MATASPATAASGHCIDHLPLTVHMHALLLAEAIAAVLVYSLFVAFAVDDDLGRPGSAAPRAPVHAVPSQPSVWPEPDPQQPWRYGDGAGPA